MTIIHPLLASRSAPNYRQSWRLAGVWRRAINLMTESGELLTLHRQGSGFGPGGWVLRRARRKPDFSDHWRWRQAIR